MKRVTLIISLIMLLIPLASSQNYYMYDIEVYQAPEDLIPYANENMYIHISNNSINLPLKSSNI